jgi:endoglucanase
MRLQGTRQKTIALAVTFLMSGCGSGGGEDTVKPWACDASATAPTSSLDPYEQAQALGKGVNFGNELEAPSEGDWSDGLHLQESHFVLAKAAGFDSVRLPIGPSLHSLAAAPYAIDASFLRRVDEVVHWGVAHDLRVVVDVHNYTELMSSPSGQRARFIALWTQLATHFKCAPDTVYYELLNEPNSGLDTATWNGLIADTITAIRAIDGRHTIVVGATNWSDESGLDGLNVPATETNAIVTFHYYHPALFCFQGKSWAGADYATTGIVWPGPPTTKVVAASGIGQWAKDWIDEYNTLQGRDNPASEYAVSVDIGTAAQWGVENNRPLWMSEFTAQDGADLDSRARWIQEARTDLESHGIPWSFWTLVSDPGTRLYDPGTKQWNTKLTAALGLSVSN